ncbi:carboxymuconolactone decarboxylase family protein [Thiotrichales bacterium 19S3-7]|nr:carboxymuconolactone decarboxylase family protein [Thiotrichales bacterium 19S3-7]MCF6802210.1 carboxymuconolactone decarboxylase family protein [Thiotrichales bacterium 19S3-11]
MSKSYLEITNDLNTYLAKLRQDNPQVMAAFSQLAKEASKDGALDKKTKELIALAIGIAVRCDGCIGFHAKALKNLGATKEEINEVCAMSVYMGGGPSLMYAADALKAFDEFSQ